MEGKKSIDQIAVNLAKGLSADELREKQLALFNRTTSATQKTAAESARDAAYTATWYAPKPAVIPKARLLLPEKDMPIERARKELWKILVKRGDFIADNENNPNFEWVFSDSDRRNIINLLKWFINDPTGDLPINRGLYICGNPGTGKTEIVRALCLLADTFQFDKAPAFSIMSEVYDTCKINKSLDAASELSRFDRVLDEFGLKTGTVSPYGDPFDINQSTIERRERLWKQNGLLTILISNGTQEQIKTIFPTMLYDRIRSFTTEVFFEGTSKRKSK